MQPGKRSTRGRAPASRRGPGRAKGRAASGGYARLAASPYGKRRRRRSRSVAGLKAAPCRRAAASAAARRMPGRLTPPNTTRFTHGSPRVSTIWARAAFTMSTTGTPEGHASSQAMHVVQVANAAAVSASTGRSPFKMAAASWTLPRATPGSMRVSAYTGHTAWQLPQRLQMATASATAWMVGRPSRGRSALTP